MQWLLNYLMRRRLQRRIEGAAANAFRANYPERKIAWVTNPEAAQTGWVVIVTWGEDRPPRRSWWAVSEYSFEAKEIPMPPDAAIQMYR